MDQTGGGGHHAYSPILKYNLQCIVGAFLVACVLVAYHMTSDIEEVLIEQKLHPLKRNVSSIPKCNFFSGKWIYDNTSYPLYREKECTFLVDDFACQKFGRKDILYQHWIWKPKDCDLPRFNATTLLEKLRGKRLVFVGDSLNKNQWMSMVCLLEPSLAPSLKFSIWKGNLITFEAKVGII
ncbi:unnamed protein product [Cuscuta epithymum]|uniref:Trichome birefringence-like N-terminal domain-containing protein n=1 Tax=Cuscuta epithymum TaxID=186058 RepID=A0AAV0GG89_9ASTE|nr:unnamed protein product [Cuscuta epithymum]